MVWIYRQRSAILARSCEPQATEWQRIGNQIDANVYLGGGNFVNVHLLQSPGSCGKATALQSRSPEKRDGRVNMPNENPATPNPTSSIAAHLMENQCARSRRFL
jgi:hypothetical protein